MAYVRAKNEKCDKIGKIACVLENLYLTYVMVYLVYMVEKIHTDFAPDGNRLKLAMLSMSVSCVIGILGSLMEREKRYGSILNAVVNVEVFLVVLHMKDNETMSAFSIFLLLGVVLLSALFYALVSIRNKSCTYSFSRSWKQIFNIGRFFTCAAFPIVFIVLFLNNTILRTGIPFNTFLSGERTLSETEIADDALSSSEVATESECEKITTIPIIANYTPQNPPVYGDEYLLANNIERIKPFVSSDEWEKLTFEEKEDAVIALIECDLRYLGIPYRINIKFEDIDDERDQVTGSYCREKREITIDSVYLSSGDPKDILRTCLHEVHHVYSGCICELYLRLSDEEKNLLFFYGVDEWCDDFANYGEKKKDQESYLNMSIERDAREFAQSESKEFLREIERLLDQ